MGKVDPNPYFANVRYRKHRRTRQLMDWRILDAVKYMDIMPEHAP